MPELPEVETVVRELNVKLKNRIIKSVEIRAPKIISMGPGTVSNKRLMARGKVKLFVKLLKNQKIFSVKRRAKLLIFNLSGPLSILAHLKMTGQFIFEDRKQRAKTKGFYRLINSKNAKPELLPSKHTHVIFTFKDDSRLYFNDVRKFGYLKLVRDEEMNQVKELKEYGPEPLSRQFTLLLFSTAVENSNKRKIKQVLMDPKIIAGIGNIYSDEILFHAKVWPMRKASLLSKKELENIYQAIKKVLKKAIVAKGSSVGDFVRTDGSLGQMGKFHFVYGRAGERCKVCGNIIQSMKLGGRTASFCPNCQK